MPTRFLAASLALLLAAGCTARTAGARIAALPGPAGSAAAQDPAAGQAGAGRDPDVWRRYVRQLPPGSRVRLELLDGRRLTGTLMGLDGDAVVVQPRTRLPEPERVIPLDQLAWLEPDAGGAGAGRAVAIGVLSGAASFLALLLVTFALYSD